MSYVYVIGTLVSGKLAAPVKIGISDNPVKRLATLKTASPNPLGISMFFGPMRWDQATLIEKTIHDSAQRFRRHGEWFGLEPVHAMSAVAAATELVCMDHRWDTVRFAKRYAELGIAAFQMLHGAD